MPRLFALIFLITGLCFGSLAFAQENLPSVRPHDLDREVKELHENFYWVELEPGEALDLTANKLSRITIDETRFMNASVDQDRDRAVLRAREVGKAVVSLFYKDGTVSTFIVKIKGGDCAKE